MPPPQPQGNIPTQYAQYYQRNEETAPANRKNTNSRTSSIPYNSFGVASAVYANIPVYEITINNVQGKQPSNQVMRRKADSWINATHILKAAGMEKSQRTKILDRTDYPHEKVQGGYGKFQGTWVSLDNAKDLARKFGVYDLIKPILELEDGI